MFLFIFLEHVILKIMVKYSSFSDSSANYRECIDCITSTGFDINILQFLMNSHHSIVLNHLNFNDNMKKTVKLQAYKLNQHKTTFTYL